MDYLLKKQAETIISDLLEDIAMNGVNKPCLVVYDRDTGKLFDYQDIEDKTRDIRETYKKVTLFEALYTFIFAAHRESDIPLTPRQALIRASFVVTRKSFEEFAKQTGIPVKVLKGYVDGVGEPSMQEVQFTIRAVEAAVDISRFM